MNKIRAAITAVHGYVPDYRLTNQELETMVDTNDEWIYSRTGIKERRILKGEGLGTSFMCIEAAKGCLEKAGVKPEDVDMVLCATITPDMVFPATANIISAALGTTKAWGYDVQAACSGFMYALVSGAQFIETGRYKNVLVIGADKMSSIINYKDRTTCIIFGDGAGAALLQPDTEGNGIIDFTLNSDGNGAQFLHQKAGGSRKPASHETVDANEHFVFQEGATVFKYAVANMSASALEIMKRNDLNVDTIDWLVPHQANRRIIEYTASVMEIGMDKVMVNIENYGNTTAGTLPLCLWNYESKLKKGDNVILAAFGGGFTWGAVYLKWAYDPK
jgi:3-oxoacyl-[acyl-carrier-protein] synthase III